MNFEKYVPDIWMTVPEKREAVLKVARLWNEAMAKFNDPGSDDIDELVPIAKYDDAFVEFVEVCERPCKFFVIGDTAYITHNTSEIHASAEELIINEIFFCIAKVSKARLAYGGSRGIKIANVFTCGAIQEKYPDGGVTTMSAARAGKNPLLVLEVAFTHERLAEHILECASYLTTYVADCMYAIGVYMPPRTSHFELTLFIMRRKVAPNARDIEKLYGTSRRLPKCRKKKLSQVTLSKEYIEKNLDVYLDFVAKLTEEDINRDATITFALKGDIFFAEEDIQVTIPNEDLQAFYRDWHTWRARRLSSQRK